MIFVLDNSIRLHGCARTPNLREFAHIRQHSQAVDGRRAHSLPHGNPLRIHQPNS